MTDRVVPNTLNSPQHQQHVEAGVRGEGGSLTLYLAAERTRDTAEANWLPTPAGKRFTLIHPFYVPKPEVLSGG
jgi:hypothetical protein